MTAENKLIVALGNPGKQYEGTRHNIAWSALEYLPFYHELKWEKKFKGFHAAYAFKGAKFFFLKPQTYMNLSGESAAQLIAFYKINLEDILIIHDDMDFPFGTLAFKFSGGSAGHNGLKSLVTAFGGADFSRLRLGIGRPERMSDASWVLSQFSTHEQEQMGQYCKLVAEALGVYMERGYHYAASLYSRKSALLKKGGTLCD